MEKEDTYSSLQVTADVSQMFDFHQPTEIKTNLNLVMPNFSKYAFTSPIPLSDETTKSLAVLQSDEAKTSSRSRNFLSGYQFFMKPVSIFGGLTSFSGIKRHLEDEQPSLFGGSAKKENQIKEPIFEQSISESSNICQKVENDIIKETSKEEEIAEVAVNDIFGEIPLENRASPSMFKKHTFVIENETINSKKRKRTRGRSRTEDHAIDNDIKDDEQSNKDVEGTSIQTAKCIENEKNIKKVAMEHIVMKISKLESEIKKAKEENVVNSETINDLMMKLDKKSEEVETLLEEKKLLKLNLEQEKLKDRSSGDVTDLTLENKRLREELDKTKSVLKTEQSKTKILETKQAKLKFLVLDAEQKFKNWY